MIKHTSGPWTTGPAFVVKAVTKDDQGRTVTNWVAECPKSGAKPIEEAYANARLIAAAPHMLAALEKARVAVVTWSPNPTEPLEEIDAALAKARGKSGELAGPNERVQQ